MIVETKDIPIESISKLGLYLSEGSKGKIGEILAYGEKIKAEGERKKKEFWSYADRGDFMKLLKYKWKHGEELENKYEYLEGIKGVERETFIKECLHDDILYSGEISKELGETEEYFQRTQGKKYDYNAWKEGGIIIEKGVTLKLDYNEIGDEGVKAIVKNLGLEEEVTLKLDYNNIGPESAKAIVENLKLKEGVRLGLGLNRIGDKGAEIISKMKLEKRVILDLYSNQIGDEGVKAIAKNLELKEGVHLNLNSNQIGDDGAKAIAENLKLKEGVKLNLNSNQIGGKGAEALSKMELKEGVLLDLERNQIGDEGAKAIAENLKLKDGVYLDLSENGIGDEGAKAIAKMNLNNGVYLDLKGNAIGDEGAKAIIENMKVSNGTALYFQDNLISRDMKEKLEEWGNSYIDNGINFTVLVD